MEGAHVPVPGNRNKGRTNGARPNGDRPWRYGPRPSDEVSACSSAQRKWGNVKDPSTLLGESQMLGQTVDEGAEVLTNPDYHEPSAEASPDNEGNFQQRSDEGSNLE